MAKITRPAVQASSSKAFISTSGDTGVGAIGAALTSVGRRTQKLDPGAASRQMGAFAAAEGNRQMESATRSIQSSLLNDNLTSATLAYDKALGDRRAHAVDKDGNPLYTSLVDDTGKLGQDVLQKQLQGIMVPEVRAKFQASFQNTISNKQVQSLSIARKQQLDHAEASYNSFRKIKVEDAKNGTLGDAPDALGDIEEALNARVVAGEITEDERNKDLAAAQRDILTFQYTKMIKEDPVQAKMMLDAGAEATQLSANDHLNLTLQTHNELAKRQKAAEVQAKSIKTLQKASFKQANDLLKKGLPVPPELLAHLQAATAGTSLEAEVRALVLRQGPVNAFAKESAADRARILAALEKKAMLTPEDKKTFDTLVALSKHMDEQIKEDVVGWASSQGLIAEKPVLDVNKDITAQMANRADVVTMVKTQYGVDTHGLTKPEVQDLSRKLHGLSADEKMVELAKMQTVMSEDATTALYTDLKIEGGDMMAVAGGLIAGNKRGIAKDLLDGQSIRQDKTIKQPTDRLFQAALSEIEIPVYRNGEQRKDVIETIRNLYAARAAAQGFLFTDEINEDIMEKAVEDATNGGAIEYNNSLVEPPIHGMDDDEFQELVEGATEAELLEMGTPVGLSRPLSEVVADANLQNIGRGRYLVIPTGGDDPVALLNEDGTPYELDFNQLEELRNRSGLPVDRKEDIASKGANALMNTLGIGGSE